jgi:hypothetical protein
MVKKFLFVSYCLAILFLQSNNPLTTIGSDYPEAINFGCLAMLIGNSPYSVDCSSGSSITPGAGYLLIFLSTGLFLIPGIVPLIGLFLCYLIAKKSKHCDKMIVVTALITTRASIIGMDYLFAGGLLCWLLSLDCYSHQDQ